MTGGLDEIRLKSVRNCQIHDEGVFLLQNVNFFKRYTFVQYLFGNQIESKIHL